MQIRAGSDPAGRADDSLARWVLIPLLGVAVAAGVARLVFGELPPHRDGGHDLARAAAAGGGDPPGGAAVPVAPQAPGPDREAVPGAADPDKDRRVGEAIRRARASTVTVEYEAGARRHVASGVVINDQGEILSIRIDPPADRNRPTIVARDSTGRRHPARWLAMDPDTGLTLLRVDSAKLRPIRLAASDPALGADIFLIGTPYGLGHSVSRGHIAGLGRRLTLGAQTLSGLIQIQASLHPGDSGAMLADLDGGWLGLVRGTLAASAVNAGRDDDLGFAIPARDALWVADRLRPAGKVDRAYLGLRFASAAEDEPGFAPPLAPPNDAAAAGAAAGAAAPADDATGAAVTAVVAGSPADRAGLRPGDRVVRLDDRPVVAANDLAERLDRTAAGAELALEYVRGMIKNRVALRASSRPVEPPAAGPARSPAARLAEPAARADDPAATIRALRDRLELLERRIEQLERPGGERGAASTP